MKVIEGATVAGVEALRADVVVVGSGGGGAPAALELAAAGHEVIVLEAGPYLRPEDFSQRPLDSSRRAYVDQGPQWTHSGSVAVLQGAAIGGSTLVNGEVCFRIPPFVLREWERDYGVRGLSEAALAPIFEEVEARIHATPNPAPEEGTGLLTGPGLVALGLEPRPVVRNVKGCRGCDYCFFGCAYGCKQSMDQSYLPAASAAGARIYSEARVEELRLGPGGRVREVIARTAYGRLKVEARAVVLACGAIATPLLLLDHGLGGGSVGRHLALHPIAGPFGVYERERPAHASAMVGAYSDLLLEEEGILLETVSAPPGFFAPFLPGFGAEHRALVRQIHKIGIVGAILRDAPGRGRVHRDRLGRKRIDYDLDEATDRKLRRALRLVSEIHFAAGATKVVAPSQELRFYESVRDLDELETLALDPTRLPLLSYHPQGTARLGEVTDMDARVEGTENLFVMDTSLFPSPVGVNTQVAVMAVSTHFARKLAAAL